MCEECERNKIRRREITITPEMITAGAKEFALFDSRFYDIEDAVVKIYTAMEEVRVEEPGG